MPGTTTTGMAGGAKNDAWIRKVAELREMLGKPMDGSVGSKGLPESDGTVPGPPPGGPGERADSPTYQYLSNSYYNLNERRKGDGGVAKKQPVDPPQQRQYSSYRDSILGTSAPVPAPAPSSTAATTPPPPPPMAPPPKLGPPTRRRSRC